MPRRSALLALLALLLAVLALIVPPSRAQAPAAPLTVLGAASLTESLGKVAQAWQAKGNGPVTLSFDSSSRLAKQVEAGVPADAFFSADLEWMDWLERRGLLVESTRVTLLGNSLVAVVPAGATLVPKDARALTSPAVRRLALAGEAVPAGKYARDALAALGAWGSVQDRVVSGDNVRSTLAWVARGEVDAGVVYATDARVEPKVKVAFTFPASSHAPITYPAAVLAGSARKDDAKRFLAYCQSSEALGVFAAAGFLPPAPQSSPDRCSHPATTAPLRSCRSDPP